MADVPGDRLKIEPSFAEAATEPSKNVGGYGGQASNLKHVEHRRREYDTFFGQAGKLETKLKAVTKTGDPVELEAEIARELGETLIRMAAEIE